MKTSNKKLSPKLQVSNYMTIIINFNLVSQKSTYPSKQLYFISS